MRSFKPDDEFLKLPETVKTFLSNNALFATNSDVDLVKEVKMEEGFGL